jgi:hypothetical protein
MELSGPSTSRQFSGDLVDALGDDQHRPVDGLRQEVAQRPVEASGKEDALTVLSNEGERAVKVENFSGVTSEQRAPSLRFVDRPEALGIFRNKVDDARNRQVSIHANKLGA